MPCMAIPIHKSLTLKLVHANCYFQGKIVKGLYKLIIIVYRLIIMFGTREYVSNGIFDNFELFKRIMSTSQAVRPPTLLLFHWKLKNKIMHCRMLTIDGKLETIAGSIKQPSQAFKDFIPNY